MMTGHSTQLSTTQLPNTPAAPSAACGIPTLLSVGNKFEFLKIELLMLDRIYNHIRKGGHWSDQLQV
jgi:hypothetical protein